MKIKATLWRYLFPFTLVTGAIAIAAYLDFEGNAGWASATGAALLLVFFCPKRFKRFLFMLVNLGAMTSIVSELLTSDDLSVGRAIWQGIFAVFFGLFFLLALLDLFAGEPDEDSPD